MTQKTLGQLCKEQIVPTSFLLGTALLLSPAIVQLKSNFFYNQARNYAISEFGDKKFPLSEIEKKEWYKFMNVRPGDKPSIDTLKNYIKNYRENNPFR